MALIKNANLDKIRKLLAIIYSGFYWIIQVFWIPAIGGNDRFFVIHISSAISGLFPKQRIQIFVKQPERQTHIFKKHE